MITLEAWFISTSKTFKVQIDAVPQAQIYKIFLKNQITATLNWSKMKMAPVDIVLSRKLVLKS